MPSGKFDYSELPKSDVTIVSFSGGKDSLATYLEVRELEQGAAVWRMPK